MQVTVIRIKLRKFEVAEGGGGGVYNPDKNPNMCPKIIWISSLISQVTSDLLNCNLFVLEIRHRPWTLVGNRSGVVSGSYYGCRSSHEPIENMV